jgi:hypothetical protein
MACLRCDDKTDKIDGLFLKPMFARKFLGVSDLLKMPKEEKLYAYSNPAFSGTWNNKRTAGVAGINAAAFFDKKTIRQRGEHLGEELRGKGASVYLRPDVNQVWPPYLCWTFGEDPFLSGGAGAELILDAFCFLHQFFFL